MVLKMSDLYNAPELRNYYCAEICPLGFDTPRVEISDLDRICVMALFSLRKMNATGELLLDIAKDGIISEDERPDMEKVLHDLEELEEITQNFKVWIRKNL